MAKHSRARTGRDLRRKPPKRRAYPRVLIVCEGTKTEVNYFEEIRQKARIPSVHLQVISSSLGTDPQRVVEGAEKEFKKSKAFEKVYSVFDRDEHLSYANAIAMAEARNGKLKNDEKAPVSFEAIVSVPCFELWLLLHFVEVMAPIHRHDALVRLRQYLPEYEKADKDTYSATMANLAVATERATLLKRSFNRLPGEEPYTDVHELVAFLRSFSAVGRGLAADPKSR